MDRLHSYPKVWNLGHPAIRDLFNGPVVVQEKVDGSQFTFGVLGGVLHFRSKGATIYRETTDKLFLPAIETATALFEKGALVEGWQYRGEALFRPKHNTLAYARAPIGGVILFDVDTGLENRVSQPERLESIARDLGLEIVPTLHVGEIADVETLRALLGRESVLGGAVVEGVVIKNYARWGEDGKMLMGKWVREEFKEQNTSDFRKRNPTKADVVEAVIADLCNPRRWEKVVQHLRDDGQLEHSPRDIGKLLKAIPDDIRAECEADIKEQLFKRAWEDIRRGVTRGVPEWYKQRLAESQFATVEPPA